MKTTKMNNTCRVLTLFGAMLMMSGCALDDDNDSEPLATGLQTMQSNGVERTYYLQLPDDDDVEILQASNVGDPDLPLIVGFHGSFASHQSWVGPNRRYDFVDVVGDDAIMVFPDALELSENNRNWNFEYDFEFFIDLLDELDTQGVEYNRNKIFVVGHSSGAGMAQEIGCRYGDRVRAIAASAGSLISGSCVGAIGVIQVQGEADTAVPYNIGSVARNFWSLYNGWDVDMTTPADVEPCVDHSLLPLGSADYPVQWCEHPGGHPWQDFNSEAFWTFFSGLPEVAPSSDEPPGGGNDAVLAEADTTMTFRLRYPDDIGTTVGGAITLYGDDYEDGFFRTPSIFLNLNWSPGQVAGGSEVLYSDVPITFFVFSGDIDFNETYILQISVYVEGGSQPIPTPCVDHKVLYEIQFVDETTPIVIGETLDVTKVSPFRGPNDPPTSCEET